MEPCGPPPGGLLEFGHFGLPTSCLPNYLECPDNPKGVASQSPGLLYSATLGDGACRGRVQSVDANPERVAALISIKPVPPRSLFISLLPEGPQPRRGWTHRSPPSQGTRVRQPRAL